MRKTRRTKALILAAIIVMGLCGCGNKAKQEEILNHLRGRYQQEFTYVSKGDKVTFDNTDCYIFLDEQGNQTVVKDHKMCYADNYSSVMYDKEISDMLEDAFKEDVKIFASTESVFFNDTAEYKTFREYMECCSVINVAVCTKQDVNYDTIAETICSVAGESAMSVVIYVVEDDVYEEIASANAVDSKDVLESTSFWVESSLIWDAGWREEQ